MNHGVALRRLGSLARGLWLLATLGLVSGTAWAGTEVSAGARVHHRLTIRGDAFSATCALRLEVAVPRGFHVVSSTPSIEFVSRLDGERGVVRLPSLAPGAAASWDLELEAPASAARGALCAEVVYEGCPNDGHTPFVTTECSELDVVGGSAAPMPTLRLVASPPRQCSDPGAAMQIWLDSSTSSYPVGWTPITWAWSVPAGHTVVGSGPAVLWLIPAATWGVPITAGVLVTNANGDTASAAVSIQLDPPPVIDVTATPAAQCRDWANPLTVNLDATATSFPSLATPTGWTWLVSPSQAIVGAGPVVAWTLPPGTAGSVVATLTVADSNGCSSVKPTTAVVYPGPWLDPLAPVVLCGDRNAAFAIELDASAATSIAGVVGITWSTTEPAATMTPTTLGKALLGFPAGWSGTAPVAVVILDQDGCTMTRSGTVLVHPSPAAGFSATIAPVGAPSGFVATSSGGTAPIVYAWDFGDGAMAVGANVAHVFASPGTYPVTLRVTDLYACVAEVTQAIVVDSPLTLALAADRRCESEANTLVATVVGGNPPLLYTWAFGDGITMATTSGSTTHTYAGPGTYTAAVLVRDALGTEASASVPVVVSPLPPLSASTSGSGLSGQPQDFHVTSPVPLRRVEWRFDDGIVLSGADVSRLFANAGAGVATVSAESTDGCPATAAIAYRIDAGTTTVSLAKTVSSVEARPGEVVEYTLLVANGGGRLNDIRIEDTLPAFVSYVPFTMSRDGAPMPEPVAGFVMSLASFPLSADTITRIKYRAVVADDAASGDYVNRATLRGRDANGVTLYAGPKSARLRVIGRESAVDLRIRKTADPDPNTPVAGGIVHYRLDYENAGTATATDVVVRDDYPENLASIEENGDLGVVLGGRIEWKLRPMVAGASGRLQYSLRLHSDLPSGTAIANLVVISSSEPDWNSSDNSASSVVAIGGLPNLALTKTVSTSPDPAEAGATASYELSWRNLGIGVAPGAVIVDDYDESKLEIVTPPAGASDEGGVLRIELGDVAAGAGGVVRYTALVRAGATAEVLNAARLTSELVDEDESDNSAAARFDIVENPGTLRALGRLERMRRCLEPQIETVLRSDHFDTALAMLAAFEVVDGAARLEQEVDALPILERKTVRSLSTRLRAIARANVDSLFLRSGMGLSAEKVVTLGAGPSPEDGLAIYVPFVDAHPLYRGESGQLDETWCTHPEHRRTSLGAVGYGLAAIAAQIGLARGDDASARPLAAITELTLGWLEQALVSQPWTLDPLADGTGNADEAMLPVDVPTIGDYAAIVRGLARFADLDQGVLSPRAAAMLPRGMDALERELVTCDDDGSLDIAALAAASEAWHEVGVRRVASATFEGTLRAAWLRLEPTVAGRLELDVQLDAMRIAIALGDLAGAALGWAELERTGVAPRLDVFQSDGPTQAVTYTPATLAALVTVGSQLLSGRADIDRIALVQRLEKTVTTIAIEGRLQAGSRVFSGVEAPRILLGPSGALRVTSESGASFAPVLLDRVSFAAGDTRFRDLSMIEVVRGLGADGAGAMVLASGQDCQVTRTRILDRGFVTESGMFAIGEIAIAGAALRAAAEKLGMWMMADEGDRLRDLATRDELSLTLHSGLGIRLRDAAGGAGESAMLTRLARVAGLASMPPGIIPIWLPFGAGDPVFPAAVDAAARYGVGYDPSRVDADVSGAALGEVLLARVRTIADALHLDDATSRFVALTEAAATLPLARELEKGSEGRRVVVDSVGHAVENTRLRSVPRLVDRAVVVEAQCGFAKLVSEPAFAALAAAAGLELDVDRAAAAAARGVAELLKALAGGTLDGIAANDDPWVSLRVTRALLAASEFDPARAVEARAVATRIATSLRRVELGVSAPAPDLSPLLAQALTLSTLALADPDDEAVRLAYGALADRFDAGLGLFPSGVRETSGVLGDDAFVLSDRDVGATLGALARALPRLLLSEREQAIAMMRSMSRRVLFEAGLQRDHRLPIQTPDGVIGATASQISRAVGVGAVATPQGPRGLLPGDLVGLSFELANPTPASTLVGVELVVLLPEGIEYLPASARMGGRVVPAQGEREVRVAVGRLGGGETAKVELNARVATNAQAGRRLVRAVAHALDQPGSAAQPLDVSAGEYELGVDGFGSIEGRVWIDHDGDGVSAEHEPGVQAVTLVLDDGSSVVTSQNGEFRFETLVPASYETRLLDATLPGELRTAHGTMRRVRVATDQVTRVDIAVRALTDVTGIVYRDEDGDRRWSRGEGRVPRVVVTAGSARAITDDSGRYLIRGVDAGSYELRIDRRQPYVKDNYELRLWPLALDAEPPSAADAGSLSSFDTPHPR